jgi:hypothetical protein
MKDLFKEIQKILPPRGTPRQILDPGPLGFPTATFYEAIAKVEIVSAAQTGTGPSQPVGTFGPQESGRVPEQEPTQFRNRPAQLRCAGRARSGQPGPVMVNLRAEHDRPLAPGR